MKPQYEEAKRLVEQFSAEWQERLALGHFTIKQTFLETFKDDDDQDTVAVTQTFWEYRHATMRWYLPKLVAMTPAEIRHDVLHEHVHVLTSSMESELADRHTKVSEFAVQSITLSILHAVDTACIADGSQRGAD